MRRLRALWATLFRRRRLERDLHEEVRGFAAMLREEVGERAAARALGGPGGVEAIEERVRESRAGMFLATLAQDARYGARLLARSPGVAAIAILALALGIGANTALFSVVRGVLLQPLPYPQPDRLAMVYMDFAPQNNPHGHLCLADFLAWRAANRAFEDPALYQARGFAVVAGDRPVEAAGARVTASFFAALAVPPLRGRVLAPGDDQPASAPVAVVSASFWREQLGADPGAIGKPVKLDGEPYTVVGVMPAGFHFPEATSDIWTNLPLVPPSRLGPYFYRSLARLKPGVTLAAAQADTNRIGRQLGAAHPEMYRHLTLPVAPLREAVVGSVRLPLLALQGAVGLVLLIAIVNVAGLLLARAQSRAPEMAVRVSLGAGALRLLRQLLTESLILALAGGAVGVAVAAGALRWLRSANPGALPRVENVRLDGPVLAWTLAASLAAGVLFGLAPGLRAARAAREGLARAGGRSQRAGARSALVMAEIALALILLCGAGLLLRSLARLEQVDAGFRAPATQISATTISLSGPKYRTSDANGDPPAGLAFDRALLQRAQQIPGVASAALTDALPPFRESDDDTFTILGQPWTPANFPSVTDAEISPDYFATLGIPLIAGRDFTRDDAAGAAPVIIISQSVAQHHFAGENPLGHFIKDAEPSLVLPYARIVGVVGDSKYEGLDGSSEAVYRPVAQDFGAFTQVVLRSTLPAATLAPAVRRAVAELEPEAVIGPTERLDAIIAAGLGPQQFVAILLLAFAVLALLLAATGIYGVVAYSVSQRQQEIGVRMALGASTGQVLRHVLAQGTRLALAGAAIGVAGALLLTRALTGLLFQTSPQDPATFVAVAAILIGIALGASYLPARRAARLAPVEALRRE